MSEISQEALAVACADKVRQLEFSVKQSAFDSVRQELETELAIARVALLAMRERAEPVAWIAEYHGEVNDDITGRTRSAVDAYADKYGWEPALTKITPLYAAPPAPVVPTFEEWCQRNGQKPVGWVREAMKEAYEGCRAAMLGAAPDKEG
ncbi:hypothetical protein C3O70_07790 [Cronobacter sakazakii]|uniref:hypothetical protein n=1 Tax=Cronobacter sakazakii TaxID=28141 RepID=UPI000F5CBA14|nr:hypothetical protein [Cronobacter sakazakii]MDT3545656.1 hypothetical protein [Cronobacter sakazakii]RRA25910.1 hypothetical protein C3O71_19855 [Cronobacter sakazakii]RRA33832.1 hypothetical protein C3O70_07790 [Cronobacter sakazakii]HDK7338405.1 hypothetical protein [Cronobacter sakazakii]